MAMPKVSISLQAAKAKEADILAKLSKVERVSQNHKQQTKLNQQRMQWTEQARRLSSDARRLEEELQEAAESLGLLQELSEQRSSGEESSSSAWFQVAGVRQLVAQVRMRDAERLRKAPTQALSLQDVLVSVTAALNSQGAALAGQSAAVEGECRSARQALRRELPPEQTAAWASGAGERHAAENCGDLSDEEDALLEQVGLEDAYGAELRRLNDQVTSDLSELERELAEVRRRCGGWDDDANFRFVCIKKEFQGQSRDVMVDRLCLEFPHLSREQLQAHEAEVDALKFTGQRRAATFRQWRRDRLQLLRRHQSCLQERLRQDEAQQSRRQEHQEQREKQRQLHDRLSVDRKLHAAKREARERADSEDRHRREVADAEREQSNRRHIQGVKDKANEISDRKRELKAQRELETKDRERLEVEDRQRRMERNAEIVRMRRAMDDLKAKEHAQQRQAAEEERLERERRLDEALAKLRVEAPRDPERLLKVPARASAEAYIDPLTCVTRGPACGFDEKRLMADARYKISAALQAAGLYGTKAGHEVLARVAAPRPAQPHMVSQVFVSGYPG